MRKDGDVKKIIINLAPIGMVPTKAMTSHVPISPEEIGAVAEEAVRLGVSMLHLHARDADGNPTYRKDVYANIIERVKAVSTELVIVVSTSGRVCNEFDKRTEVLSLDFDLKPDMASLTLGSVNFARSESINGMDTIVRLAAAMREKGIKPELEIFDVGMINVAHYLIRKDLISPPYYFNIFLGNVSSAQAKLLHIGTMIADLPEGSLWCAAGIGNCKNMVGIMFGNGVRVGLEDNIWYDDSRTILATNASFVRRVADIAALVGREIATPADVRKMLGLTHRAGGTDKGAFIIGRSARN